MAKSKNTDKIILDLQAKIQEKKKALEKSAKPVWKSKMVINIPGLGSTINIHTLDEERGIVFLSTLISYKEALEKAIKLVPGCKKTTEEVDAWMEDIITKLQQINHSNLLASLQKDEKELDDLLSEGYKKDKKLSSILEKYA